MKKIEAILRPFQLEKLKDELARVGVEGMTVTDVRGFGRQRGHTELYRGAEYVVAFQPKVKVELFVRDDMAEKVMGVIRDAAYTGKIGDGKIFLLDVLDAMRIRTGDRGDFAVA